MMDDWIYLAVGAAAIALAICFAGDPLARRLGLAGFADDPTREKAGTAPVGGLAVAVPVLVAMAFVFDRSHEGVYNGLGLVTLAFLVLGYIDDRQHLAPAYRLVAALLFSALAIYYSPGLEVSFLRFSFLSISLFLDQWAPVFTVLCIVGLQNAVAATGDRRGLIPAVLLFWVALLFYHGTANLYPLLATLGSALAVVLVFSYRGRVSLGNSGNYSLSALVGCTAVFAYNQGFLSITADAVALMFMVPILDFTRLALSRVLEGFSPFAAERKNLLDLISDVFGGGNAPFIYFALVALPNIMAAVFPEWTALWMVLVALVYAVAYTVLSRRAEGRTLA